MPLLLPRVRQIKLKRRIRMHYAVEQGRKYNPLRFDHPTRFVRALVTKNIDGRTTAKRRILGRSGNWPRQSQRGLERRPYLAADEPPVSSILLCLFRHFSLLSSVSLLRRIRNRVLENARTNVGEEWIWRGYWPFHWKCVEMILRFFDLKDGRILYISFV